MKKFFAFLFISALLFNVFGYQILFNTILYKIQREVRLSMRKEMKDEELSLIISTSENEKDFFWTKPGKEFRYGEEMYDVVKTKTKDHKKYFYCIRDVREKKLLAQYKRTHNTSKETEKRMKHRGQIQLFVKSLIPSSGLTPSDFNFAQPIAKMVENTPVVLSPPPEIS